MEYAQSGMTVKMVENFLDAGVDVNAIDTSDKHFGYTALMYAAATGQISVVKTLLDKGADVDILAEDGAHAILLAAAAGHSKILEMLLRESNKLADVDMPKYRRTPLYEAVSSRSLRCVELVLKSGNCDVNRQCDEERTTALMLAVGINHVPMVRLLLKHKAKVDIKSATGFTAFDVAKANHNSIIIDLLEKAAK